MAAIKRFLRLNMVLFFTVFLVGNASAANKATPAGQSRFSEENHIEYIIGNMPIIISAPHGGRINPENLPDRTKGTLVTDSNTDHLARDIAQALFKKTGRYPHVIICHLKRIKVDCNRSIEKGTTDHPVSKRTWNQFHNFIEEARRSVISTHGSALYIDLHGHGRPAQVLHLGYLISNIQLKGSDNEINNLAGKSSIRNLAANSNLSFTQILRGDTSFGALMHQRGYPSVPSPAKPHMGNAKFFSGGYSTRRYCTRDEGKINGFQLESPRRGFRDTDTNRKAFAEALADAVIEYMNLDAEASLRVAVFKGAGVGSSSKALINALSSAEQGTLRVLRITADEIRNGMLSDVDVLIHPGGSGSGQGKALGESGRSAVREFVREGGGYLGVCAGAYLATSHYSWSLKLIDAKVVDTQHWARGKGPVKLRLSAEAVKLFGVSTNEITSYYAQGPLLTRHERNDPEIPDYESLAVFATEIAENGAPEGVMKGKSAAVRCEYGSGRVFCFSPHPELTTGQNNLLLKAVEWISAGKQQ